MIASRGITSYRDKQMNRLEHFPSTENEPNYYQAHLSDYLTILKRRKGFILLFWFLIVGLAALYLYTQERLYRSTALIMVEGKASPENPLGETEVRPGYFANPYYTTEINLLSHRALVQSVIEELELEAYYISQLDEPTDNTNSPDPAGNGDSAGSLKTSIIEWYLKNLEIVAVPESNLVHINFTGPDPELITRVVNMHAQKAIKNTVQLHQERAKSALDWLKAQVQKQKNEVEVVQRQIYEFKKNNDLMITEDRENIFSQEFTELNSALIKAKADHITRQAAYLQLDKVTNENLDTFLLPEISNDPTIQSLKAQLAGLKARQTEMTSKFGPKHPKMIELNSSVKQVKAEIDAEIARLRKTIRSESDRAASIEDLVTRQLEQKKKTALSLGEKIIEYDVLQQQASSARDIYNFLLKQAEEISLASVMNSSNIRVIDQAERPMEPVQPKIMIGLFLAACLGLFIGTGMAFFLEYMDNTLKTPMDVTIRLGMPVLGTIPFYKAMKNRRNLLLTYDEDSQKDKKAVIADPLSHISSRLPAELSPTDSEGYNGRVIAVESVTMGEGKTMIVSKIAANLTDAGLRVLLLDTDFQRSSVNQIFDIRNGSGLENTIDKIQSLQVNGGDLKDFSIDDIFFLVLLKRLNGQLVVRNDDQMISVYFQNGQLLHIQNNNNPDANRIGTMLLQGNFISREQLRDALHRHSRTGQPIGYILVNSGFISRDKLRGPLRLQMEEHIQKVFSWKSGRFAFKPELLRIYENERIFFGEDYSELINNLGRVQGSKIIEKEIFSNISSTDRENLYVLPANSTTKKPIGRINRALFKKLLEIVRQRFDVILIDTPPLDAQTGVESIFSFVDGVVFVISAGNLSYKVINNAISSLPRDKIIGAVLNKVKTKPDHYSYYM